MAGYDSFSSALIRWHRTDNHREMPWKGERDPYLIWLSEIILQQTRVEQGLPYFLRFREKYPTVSQLADAPEDEVMRLWQGLGYYSRARNLHTTAKYIAYELNGRFPDTYEEIWKLKGIGPYTAAAISSFAFGERRAVVDGNVIRILARVYGIDTAFDTTEGKKKFAMLAQELISLTDPAGYNQAIMDFGAKVCMPAKPLCDDCPLSKICLAFKGNLQAELPVRSKKIVKKERFFYYVVIKSDKEIIISKRLGSDIWKGLYELPMIESAKPISRNIKKIISDTLGIEASILNHSKAYVQQLTHQTVRSVFIFADVDDFQSVSLSGAVKVSLKNLHNFAFPKVVHLFLSENSLL
jgi:A/G-specific adenine glycosylase